MSYQVLSDEYIKDLFKGKDFGHSVNGNVEEMRSLIKEGLKNQLDGFWTGETLYSILVDGGFLFESKTTEQKRLTWLGLAFLEVGR